MLAGTLPSLGFAVLALCLAACSHGKPANPQAAAAAQAARQQKRAEMQADVTYSRELDQIPPPSKNLYMTVHKRANWSNPFLIVGVHTVDLRVEPAGAAPGNVAPGPTPHTKATRWRQLNLQLADLPEALAALPEDTWPYGRVIAVEDDPRAPRNQRVQVRRTEEATLRVLNDMGVVVYEWPGNGPGQ